jgi:hypothetical protein
VSVWETVEQDDTGLPIQIAVDPDGVPVFLSRAVWEGHILLGHPEMIYLKDLILATISTPMRRIFESENIVRMYGYIPDERNLSMEWRTELKVVVKYVKPPERDYQETGLISSVYPVRTERKPNV